MLPFTRVPFWGSPILTHLRAAKSKRNTRVQGPGGLRGGSTASWSNSLGPNADLAVVKNK